MVRRMLSWFMVLAVAGAPVASQACLIACGSPVEHAGILHSAMHGASHESGHSCHDAAGTAGPQMRPVPHSCGHDREGQTSIPSISVPATQGWTSAALALMSASLSPFADRPSLMVAASPLSVSLTGSTFVRSAMALRI